MPVCGVKPLAAIVPVFTYTVHISALLKRTTTVALSPNKNLLDGVAQLRVFLNILKQKMVYRMSTPITYRCNNEKSCRKIIHWYRNSDDFWAKEPRHSEIALSKKKRYPYRTQHASIDDTFIVRTAQQNATTRDARHDTIPFVPVRCALRQMYQGIPFSGYWCL